MKQSFHLGNFFGLNNNKLFLIKSATFWFASLIPNPFILQKQEQKMYLISA